MHIAIVKSDYTPFGGAEKYTTRLIDAFLKNNIAVDVITSIRSNWPNANEKLRQITLKHFPYNNLLRLLTFHAAVRRFLKRSNYDCILGMECIGYETHLRAGGGSHAAWIRRRCSETSWLRCTSFKINPFHRAMISTERRAFGSTMLQRIICNSHLVAREIAHFYPEAAHKIAVVHNGVEWRDFETAFEAGLIKRSDIVRTLNLNPERFYYLFVGSGFERKGLAKAIRALRHLPSRTHLLIVGKDRHQRKYEGLCKKLHISDRVHFFGPQKNVLPFFQVSDAFVLPTIYDPFSNASLEALAMGLYLVTSDANGCAEVMQEGAGMVIRDLQDEQSVALAMKSALEPHLSKRAIRETVRHLDFETQLQQIVDICARDMGATHEAGQ